MRKVQAEKLERGFKVTKAAEQIEKEKREERMKARKVMDKSKVTIADVFEYLQDTNDRLSEIYDRQKATQINSEVR